MVQDYVGQHPLTTVTVNVFPAHRVTHVDYYDDDGETYAYQHGDYFLQRLSIKALRHSSRLEVGARRGSYRPALENYLFAVHGVSARAVTVHGHSVRRVANGNALARCLRACRPPLARAHLGCL